MSDKEPIPLPKSSAEPKEPRCPLCIDTGYVVREGGGGRTVCSCGQLLELLYSTFEDMKVYLTTTGLELRISPGALAREWTVHIHSVTEYNVGVGQDLDLLQALRIAIQSAMRRTLPPGRKSHYCVVCGSLIDGHTEEQHRACVQARLEELDRRDAQTSKTR